ncbi:MAG: TolC family protein [Bacteroidota bacterium]|nr:TolC family protein [Bacteroidota bacterium]
MPKKLFVISTAGTSVLIRLLSWIFPLFLLIAGFEKATAQPTRLSIKEALQKVQANLPQLEAFRQQASATQQDIRLAKNSIVPDLTVGYQVNLATFNNITGMSYPGFLLPVSGPPSINNDLNFVPGSAAGALIKWNPVSFGQRSAAIEKATAQFKQANATYNEQLFQYQYNAINIYLEAVYYKHLLKNVQAAIDRNNTGLEQSLVLAKTGLRPGIDTSRFQSAIAQSEIDFLQTERVYQQELTELSRLTGIDSSAENIVLTDTLFNTTVMMPVDTVSYIITHPYFQTLEAQKNSTAASLKEIQKSWVPQLDIWGNIYSRGSGVDAAGHINKPDGFNLSRTNAGVGIQLSFPVLQYSKVNIKKRQYQSLLKADEARLAQAQRDITKQTATALQQYQQDIKIAGKSPVLLKAATAVYEGLKLSYETGLTDYTQLAQAQYELLKAEVNDANALLQLWRSLLAVAVAKGNLNLFTDQLK